MSSRRCTAVCLDGTPCQAWAVHGTDPPRCAAHGGTRGRIYGSWGDTPLSDDCSIDVVIDDLYRKQMRLSDTIDRIQADEDATLKDLVYLLRIHGQNAGRLGRLLRHRRALGGDAADGISGAIAQALDELSTELGTEL